MKLYYYFILLTLLFQTIESYSNYINFRGETISSTAYLNSISKYDSLDFVFLFDRDGKKVDVSINKSINHFTPQGRQDLIIIQVDYSFKIPDNFSYPDSLFKFGYKTREQYDTTYSYNFYILKEFPVSNIKFINPYDNQVDVSIKPTFEWTEEINHAIRSYKFQLSENSNFTTIIIDTILFSNKLILKNELMPTKKYYCRVKSDFFKNDDAFRSVSFTTGAKTIWNSFEIDKYHYAMDIQLLDSGRLILADHQVGFQISDDNGITWKGVKVPNIIPISITPVIGNTILSPGFDYNDQKYKILKSIDNGSSWSIYKILPDGPSYSTDKKFQFLINNKNNLTLTYINKIYKYSDFSLDDVIYEAQLDTSVITGVVELQNSNLIAITETRYTQENTDKGDIFLISEKGKIIKKVFSDFNGEIVDFVSVNLLENGYIIASGIILADTSVVYFISKDNGENWELASKLQNTKLRRTISTFDGDLISHITDGKRLIILSKDYGKNWIDITGNMPIQNTAYDIKIIADSTLYYLSNSNRLYRTNIRSGIEMSIFPNGTLKAESAKINLKWKHNQRAEKYNIQIAENEDFVKKTSVTEVEIFVDDEVMYFVYPFSGFEINKKYYWRVRPYYENKWMNWYQTNEFQITEISSILPVNYELIDVEIFPNPAYKDINLKVDEFSEFSYQLFNGSGTDVTNLTNISSNNININNLPTGTYYIKLCKNNLVYTARFIKN